MATVDANSDLKRRKWMRDGLLLSSEKSFWTPLTGNTPKSIVYQAKNGSAADGHTVVFDYAANLSGRAYKGREQAYGKGEAKRLFSSMITVNRYRQVVDNGDKFDGVDIGNLAINEHQQSRGMLADLFQKFKDQMLFDCAQGLNGQNPSHVIDVGTGFGYNKLLEIEKVLKTSNGFTTGGVRRPLDPYQLHDGRPCWMFVVDAAMATQLKSDSGFQTLVYNADVRGDDNRAIKGVIGKLGNLLIVEAPLFFGDTEGTGVIEFEKSEIEMSGLRQRDGNNVWTGQTGFNYNGDLFSRGVLLGASALQLAFGKQPDYKLQNSTDFEITSESALEAWLNAQKTVLKSEISDYKQAKVAEIDFGVVAVEAKVQSAAA